MCIVFCFPVIVALVEISYCVLWIVLSGHFVFLQCELLMLSRAHGEVGSVLFSLFWSVQGSLLSWCFLQLKSTDTAAKELATDLIEKCECQQSMVADRGQNLTRRECPSSVTHVLTYQVCTWLPVSQPCNKADIYLSSLTQSLTTSPGWPQTQSFAASAS